MEARGLSQPIGRWHAEDVLWLLADSTTALSLQQGWDVPAAVQRRQSFPVLLLLLSSVIKGRGKSRGDGCALIAFHGREEKATACPGGPRHC